MAGYTQDATRWKKRLANVDENIARVKRKIATVDERTQGLNARLQALETDRDNYRRALGMEPEAAKP
jgi:septal ring factor EnvC (AmiA/AmiB activator)